MKCLSPITIKNPDKFGVPRLTVPCGKCIFCLSRKRIEWFVRVKNEYQNASSAFFITLTYDDEKLKYHERSNKISLSVIDIQLYMKRLRKAIVTAHRKRLRNERNVSKPLGSLQNKVSEIALKCPNIKYYFVGEYGSETNRPHYHAIIFNVDIGLKHLIAEAWNWGFVRIDQVNDASIMYVCKYIISKYNEYVDIETGEFRQKPFALISKSLGIDYVSTHKKFHRETGRFYVEMEEGKKYPLPRYYKEKIFTKNQIRKHAKETQKNLDEIEITRQEFHEKRGENPFHHEMETNQQKIEKITNNSKSKKV